MRIRSSFELRNIVSISSAVLVTWVLVSRFITETLGYQFQSSLLRVFAKCPGLPYGAYSGGPDYIDISIDISLAVVAAVFIYLTVRDIRRKRRAAAESEERGRDFRKNNER